MNKEKWLTIVTCVICLSGCIFISVFNVLEANYQYAEMIPASEYHSSIISEDRSGGVSEQPADDTVNVTVNINTASAEELAEKLPGIGIVKARRIVDYRALIGGFESVDQLKNVDGIGDKTIEKIRPYCRIKD
jgi:competence protein ComEA helix-hairpin-helix repeat region